MDLRAYYKKIRDFQEGLGKDDVIVCSLDTPDGGKAGVFTEVSPRVASQLIEDRRARLASAEETAQYRAVQAGALKREEEKRTAERIEVHLLTSEPKGKKK